MENEVQQGVRGALMTRFDELKELDPNSKEYGSAIMDIKELHAMYVEDRKIDEQRISREEESRTKDKQLRSQKLLSYIEHGVKAGAILAYLGFNCYWWSKGFKFEETGTVTSDTFKWIRGSKHPKL